MVGEAYFFASAACVALIAYVACIAYRLSDEVDTVGGGGGTGGMESLAGKVGETLVDRVFDCVYTDCLSHIVQSSSTTWPTLDHISTLAERFQTNIARHLHLQQVVV